jgi:hypothetical protein
MFKKRFDNDLFLERQELRDVLADRLRLAFDFATLGAYELTGPDGEASEGGAQRRSAERIERSACTGAAPKRHVSTTTVSCPAPTESRRTAVRCSRGGRRAGSVPTPEQPCTCS